MFIKRKWVQSEPQRGRATHEKKKAGTVKFRPDRRRQRGGAAGFVPFAGDRGRKYYKVARLRGDRDYRPMDSHEVMREVLKQTSAKQIAADMQLSLSLIYKWAEPPDGESGGGASSPLDRVGQLLRSTRDVRIAQWVCEQANGFYIRNPQNLPTGQPLVPMTNDIVKEFADMLATIAVSSADSVITKEEARKIRARWEELKSVTEGFVHSAEKGNFGPPKDEAAKKS